MSSHRLSVLLVIGLLAPLARGQAREPRERIVAMRDGVELATTVYLPETGEPPWPAVLARTPYNRNGLRGVAQGFAGRGFAFVAQDCRGRFASAGKYDPFRTDHTDGYDTVEWVAGQDWCDSRVGMWGASALGITSNLAATQVPPHLVCAYVAVAPASARRNTVYMGGVYRKELNDGWLAAQNAAWAIDATLAHPAGSPHWDWREIADFHDRIRIPIYHFGGWFDIFAQGTIDNFVGLQARGAGLAAGNQKLVMGPFAHGALGGRLRFPDADAGAFLAGEEPFLWFERWLKGVANEIDSRPPVRYYLMGDTEDPQAPGNEWRSAPSWPPPSRPRSFFLAPDHALEAGAPPAEGGAYRYRYDPKKPVPTQGGGNLILGGKGPLDQRDIGERQDYLRFQSAPLARPLEVVGRVTVDLYVASDAPDTDFCAKLVDVYPDGYEALILDGILRARYREGLDRELPLETAEAVHVRIDLWSTAIVFNRGHRIALHLSSSNDPRFDPNANTGGAPRAEEEPRVADNSIHFGGATASRLLLPLVKEHEVADPPPPVAGDASGEDAPK